MNIRYRILKWLALLSLQEFLGQTVSKNTQGSGGNRVRGLAPSGPPPPLLDPPLNLVKYPTTYGYMQAASLLLLGKCSLKESLRVVNKFHDARCQFVSWKTAWCGDGRNRMCLVHEPKIFPFVTHNQEKEKSLLNWKLQISHVQNFVDGFKLTA